MGHGRGKSCSRNDIIFAPDFAGAAGSPVTVTGTLTPNATGSYSFAGIYNDTHYFRRSDGAYYIWFNPDLERWYISANLGDISSGYWSKAGYRWLTGLWSASGGYAGVASIAIDYAGPIDMAVTWTGSQTRFRPDLFENFDTLIALDRTRWGIWYKGILYTPSSIVWDGPHGLYLYLDFFVPKNKFHLFYDGRQADLISLTLHPLSAFYGMRYWL